MKPEEVAAHNYLKNSYGSEIIFEPDGNIPPDFLVQGRFAVEVRRLNQQFVNNDNAEGLEILTSSIFKAIDEALKSFNVAYMGKTYWIDVKYWRPLEKRLHKIKIDAKNALRDFLDSNQESPLTIKLNNNFELNISKATVSTAGSTFVLGGGQDRDAGGWVLPMYADNIQQCINQKSSKLRNYVSKYGEWWLVLVDYMEWGLDDYAREILKEQIRNLGIFQKVILISRDGSSLLTTLPK